jgi:hypothetical protein
MRTAKRSPLERVVLGRHLAEDEEETSRDLEAMARAAAIRRTIDEQALTDGGHGGQRAAEQKPTARGADVEVWRKGLRRAAGEAQARKREGGSLAGGEERGEDEKPREQGKRRAFDTARPVARLASRARGSLGAAAGRRLDAPARAHAPARDFAWSWPQSGGAMGGRRATAAGSRGAWPVTEARHRDHEIVELE